MRASAGHRPPPAALDRALPIPLYFQLKSLLLRRIETGELAPSDRLETEHELARRYGVSKATVRQALAEMAQAGYLRREQGRGTFVTEPRVQQGPRELTSFSEDMRRRNVRARSKVLSKRVVTADPVIAEKLGLVPGARVFRLERLRLADGEPLAIQTAFIPLEMAPDLAGEELTGSLYEILEKKYGLVATWAREKHFAALLGPTEVRQLGAAPGSPGLCAERVAFLPDARPLEYTRSVMRADRYQITLDLVRSGEVTRHPRVRGSAEGR
jgi:GntR family transcriptional regulator